MATVAKRFGGKVKAAGGVRSYSDAVKMIEAGAYPFFIFSILDLFLNGKDRLGTSSGVAIMQGLYLC